MSIAQAVSDTDHQNLDCNVKSEVISTYALCGFSNFGSMGITLGSIGALVPNRKQELSIF
ncbi:hypothetical protein CHS0354_037064 [Potamilus streckersoni]|uniref:Concentrative nucleoside transporter C-terminal domain-containing protein n=1 Tax=Potamilus streckersoni TaxID=2493646 RepID=A0AAE0VT82_9BIVA|nr:hypothetical protein CHS0354_037064 [Potamilus streckersoni]